MSIYTLNFNLLLSPSFSLSLRVFQVAQSFPCLQQTGVLLKGPLLFWTVTRHTTPESISGTCLKDPYTTPVVFNVMQIHALQWICKLPPSVLQLQVGSRRCASPSNRRGPSFSAPRLPHYWPDVVRWHWGLHLHCDITGWQRLSLCTPGSHVSADNQANLL